VIASYYLKAVIYQFMSHD